MKIKTNSGIFNMIHVNTYDTWLSPDELFRQLEKYEDTSEVWADFQFDVYGEKLAKELELYYEDELLPILKKIGVSHIKVSDFRSPKEYNFDGDTVTIKFTYDGRYTMSRLRKYLTEQKDSLRDYLKDNYASCSGFHSFIVYNDVHRFISMVGDDERSTAIALQFYAENDDNFDVRQEKFEEICEENIAFYDCLNETSVALGNKLYEEGELFYFIDLDERGEFRASLRNRGDETLIEIDDSFFVDGFMKHKEDTDGLLAYVQSLGYITTKIVKSN